VGDPFFGAPVIDIDEWRDKPYRHRYMHGAFDGTDTRFSFYFVPESDYRGRFLQWLEGGFGGHEHEALNLVAFAASCGAYVIESNQGHIGVDPGPPDPSITGWRASEATARLASEHASEMYGSPPHHGYLYGGSGGGMRTILGLENVRDVWHGGVPFVAAGRIRGGGGVNIGSIAANVNRLLGRAIVRAVDALEPGGSGDPYAGLNDEQSVALRALLDGGFQPRALFQLDRPSIGSLLMPMMMNMMAAVNPQYFTDFWNVPGHAGADGGLRDVVIERRASVRDVLPTEKLLAEGLIDPALLAASSVAPSMELKPVGLVIDDAPAGSKYADAHMLTGAASGSHIPCFGTFGDVVVVSAAGAEQAAALAPGDEFELDNKKYLAFCHAYLDEGSGSPAQESSGGVPQMRGDFTGKMIIVNSLLDDVLPPVGALGYRDLVKSCGRTSDFRLWWNDNAAHVPGMILAQGEPPVMESRLGNYIGSVEQAMRDVIAWVEDGLEPPSNSAFELAGAEVVLAPSAHVRAGIQPVVIALANGSDRAEVAAGTPVTLEVVADVPPGAGTVISAQWDFEADGNWSFRHDEIDGSSPGIRLATSHSYEHPGVYFPAVQVVSHRGGDVHAADCRVENLGRARVVVT
jgi:hypothetical protein